jgi:hypothetical protein
MGPKVTLVELILPRAALQPHAPGLWTSNDKRGRVWTMQVVFIIGPFLKGWRILGDYFENFEVFLGESV